MAAAKNGTTGLTAFYSSGPELIPAVLLLAAGFLIKIGTIGVHVWLPGAYAQADDDLSAMLSAVVGKVAIFALFITAYLAVRSELGLDLARAIGWIGMLTTVVGALLALQQAAHEAYACLFQPHPDRLHRHRRCADEPSRLGDGPLSGGEPSDGQRSPLSDGRGHHSTHGFEAPGGLRGPRTKHAADLCHFGYRLVSMSGLPPYRFYRAALAPMLRPYAERFWDSVSRAVGVLGEASTMSSYSTR